MNCGYCGAPEEWRPIPLPGAEGYEISDAGRVRSFRPWRGKPGPRILKGGGRVGGYPLMYLSGAGSWTAHRLVLLAFEGPSNGLHVRHLDGDETNTCRKNLAYGTVRENIYDTIGHGRHNNAGKTHCLSGHEFTPENTYIGKRADGRTLRVCRICRRRWARESAQRAAERRAAAA